VAESRDRMGDNDDKKEVIEESLGGPSVIGSTNHGYIVIQMC
jgi:hypothetical protein